MKNDDILEHAHKNYERALSMEMDNRQESLISSKFADGDQWPDEIKEERYKDKRPCLTINKLRKFIYQVMGDIQQNRPSLQVRPVDSISDPAGAQLRNDIINHIEHISTASDVYDTAIQQALEGGYGYWRLTKKYADDTSFDQDIIITPVINRFSVVLDQRAQKKNYEDAKFGFIIGSVDENEFKDMWPKAGTTDFMSPYGDEGSGWYEEGSVKIAEYFWKEYEKSTLYQIDNGSVVPQHLFNEMIKTDQFKNLQDRITNEREIRTVVIKQVKMSYNAILEGPETFPGEYIPIIPVLGYEHNDEGQRKFRSIIHDSIDSMRMFNYWKTYSTEMIALSPKVPYKLTPQQIEGHESQWNEANISPMPYMLYNNIPGTPLPQREAAVPVPSAAINESNMAVQDIQDTIGMYAPSMGQPSNERSGRAIIARQRQSGNTIYTFINNLQSAILLTGRIILSMIPKVYDTNRIIKIIGKEGIKQIEINYKVKDPATLVESIQNDLSAGKYDMIPTIGPNFATKRMETAASMLDFLQFVPVSAPIIAPKLAKLLDWEGAQNIGDELTQLFAQAANQKQSKTSPKQATPDNMNF